MCIRSNNNTLGNFQKPLNQYRDCLYSYAFIFKLIPDMAKTGGHLMFCKKFDTFELYAEKSKLKAFNVPKVAATLLTSDICLWFSHSLVQSSLEFLNSNHHVKMAL